MYPRYHHSFHVSDLDVARGFYSGILGCREGRSTSTWVDFDFWSHQLSLHLGTPTPTTPTGLVDGKAVPMPHFGLCLPLTEWQALAVRLKSKQINFVLPPHTRYAGQVGEQGTMFFCDPFGNAIEIKGFADFAGVFAA